MSAGERLLRAAVVTGDTVDLRGRPGSAGSSGGVTVRAEFIAALLLNAPEGRSPRVPAVRLVGARILGELNLTHGELLHPLMLRACDFSEPIVLDYAVAQSIDLRESRFPRLHADGVRVAGNLDLRDAVVGGDPQNAEDEAAEARGVRAVGARVDADFYAGGIIVSGGFIVVGADIAGVLTLRYALLANPGGVALEAGGLRTGRGLLLSHLRACGEARLPGARIGSIVRLDNAQLSNPGGRAVSAQALVTESDIFAERLRVEGSVYMPGARIGGSFHLDGAALSAGNPAEPAIDAIRMTISRSLYLNDGFTAGGELRFTGMQVAGHMDIVGMQAPDALLNLYGAHVSDVHDDFSAWPAMVDLDGFTYDSLLRTVSVRQRLNILTRLHGDDPADRYRPHPYEELAAHQRALGHDDEARTVLLARQRARRRTLPLARRMPGYLLDALVGYGYRPLRAVTWATGLLIAGSFYFAHVHPVASGPGTPEPFNPLLFTADQLIPIVQFGQQNAWHVHGAAQYVAIFLTACGWTLGIAIAAAVTRVLTRS